MIPLAARSGRQSLQRLVVRALSIVAFLLVGPAQGYAQSLAPPGATSCSGCHGPARGAAVVPSFDGWSADDIAAAMREYRTGERPATVMNRIAKGFTEEETRALAAWLSRGPR